MNFHGKTAIVTGGTGALGRTVVERFFDSGSNVAVPYAREASVHSIPKRMLAERDRVLLVQADLTREDQVTSFLSHVSGVFGSVHYLAHTAGGYRGGSAVADVPTDEWEAMINVNLRTAFLVCRGVLDMMRRQNFGRIVNVAAMSALAPGAKKAAYAVSKRGVVTLTETIAEEVKGTGITANAIAPSIILTEENRQSMPNADFTKWVTPEEIAQLILYLCSDRSRSINGNVIKIYGGM